YSIGTELQVNGGQLEYLTNIRLYIKDGFLYNFLDHSHESHCLVSRYVPKGWILTREAMLDLIVSGLAKPLCTRIHAKVLIWTDEMVWTVGKRPPSY
ncbi:hypothetical protein TNCV_155851, partial [Trichonephila clavipes]